MTALQPDSAPVAFEVVPSTAGDVVSIDLSASINASFRQARDIAADSTTKAKAAIAKAIECGGLLLRQKESLPHGAWQSWLTTHCPVISGQTARRYILLAKRSHVSSLEDAANLRQAYVATGMLEAGPRVRPPTVNTPTVTFIRGLDQFRRWFHRRTEELPLEKWTPDARRILRNELAWFKRLHDRLAS